MTDGVTTSAQDAVPADPHLEQWIAKAAAHSVHLPAMWRALKASELHTIVPCDPGTSGEFEMAAGDGLTVVTLEDREGRYAPVFTHLEQADETCARLGDDYGIASLDAAVLFEILAGAGHRVVINPFSTPRLSITPETVRELASGHFSAHLHDDDPDFAGLFPIPAIDVPQSLLFAARGFCGRRRVLSALYLFHPTDPETLDPNFREYRFLLRMHLRDDQFCKDFKQAAVGAAPRSKSVNCIAVLDKHTEAAAFLSHLRPIWPV